MDMVQRLVGLRFPINGVDSASWAPLHTAAAIGSLVFIFYSNWYHRCLCNIFWTKRRSRTWYATFVHNWIERSI